MTQLFKVTKVRFHACIHDYEYLCDWIKVYVSGRSWGLEKAHHLVSVVPISDINFIHNKVLFARSPMLTSTRCTISYQTHKNNMLSLDDIILNGNNTYARPRRIRSRHCCFVSSVFWRIGCSILAPHNTFVLLLHYQLDDSFHQKHIL